MLIYDILEQIALGCIFLPLAFLIGYWIGEIR